MIAPLDATLSPLAERTSDPLIPLITSYNFAEGRGCCCCWAPDQAGRGSADLMGHLASHFSANGIAWKGNKKAVSARTRIPFDSTIGGRGNRAKGVCYLNGYNEKLNDLLFTRRLSEILLAPNVSSHSFPTLRLFHLSFTFCFHRARSDSRLGLYFSSRTAMSPPPPSPPLPLGPPSV